MKSILYLILILFTTISFSQEKPSKKEVDKTTQTISKMMSYFKEYEKGNNTESGKKAKLNKVIDELNPNLSKKERNQAYNIINTYIQADQGKEVKINTINQDEIANYLQKIENGKKEALGQLNRMNNDGKIDMVKRKTFNDINDSGLKIFDDGVHFTWFTYEEYEAGELKAGIKPEYIRPTYEILIKRLKNKYKNFVDPKYKYSINPTFQ